MQDSLHEAKSRLVANVSTNFLNVGVNVLVGIWLTQYLIRNLGIEVYGMVPLVISFVLYFNLFTMSISATVSRFISIHLNKNEISRSNEYFNTSLFSILIIACILLVPTVGLSFYFSDIFHVPSGHESTTNWMFFYVILSSIFFSISTPFQVSTFVTHRFDMNNYVTIISRLLRVVLLFVLFRYLGPSLRYFGISYAAMALFYLISFMLLTKLLTPQLKIGYLYFRREFVFDMGKMSGWIAINQVGAILYMSVSFILINVFLGSEQVGRYGIIAQLAILMTQLGNAMSNIFAPIAFDYIARDKIDAMVYQIQRATKLMTLLMAFPIGLLCGFSKPILMLWLGEDFVGLWPLAWLVLGPRLITISVKPLFAVFRGLNKVKMPAIVTLLCGIVNVILCVILIKFTSLGIYGVGISLLVCLAGKNLLFTPIYVAVITNQPKVAFFKEFFPGLVMFLLLSLGAHALNWKFYIVSITQLISFTGLVFLLYSVVCYFAVLNKEDKRLLWSLVSKRN